MISSIFSGMPSLLKEDQPTNPPIVWPSTFQLPPLEFNSILDQKSDQDLSGLETHLINLAKSGFLRGSDKKITQITKCPHIYRKHYAKSMCNNCYHSSARPKKATKCAHKESQMYAKGMCLKCYHRSYKRLIKNSKQQRQEYC